MYEIVKTRYTFTYLFVLGKYIVCWYWHSAGSTNDNTCSSYIANTMAASLSVHQGPVSIKRYRLTTIGIPMLKIRRSHGNPHTWERRSLYWDGAQHPCFPGRRSWVWGRYHCDRVSNSFWPKIGRQLNDIGYFLPRLASWWMRFKIHCDCSALRHDKAICISFNTGLCSKYKVYVSIHVHNSGQTYQLMLYLTNIYLERNVLLKMELFELYGFQTCTISNLP